MAKSYFQGWYFKIQNAEKTIAFIPAKHINSRGNTTASLQVITDTGAWSVSFPGYQYIEHEKPFFVRVGENFFSEDGMELNTAPRFECDRLRCPPLPDLAVKGSVRFRQITPIAYDIMGPFCRVPFMECRHSVFSMTHRVDGCLTVNGEKYVFDNAIGYIEGDRGRSFPKEYLWTQCNFMDEDGGPASLMLSVADIPLAGLHFTGVISVIWWKGKEYRLATYLGAKAVRIAEGAVTVRQGPYTLTARLMDWSTGDAEEAGDVEEAGGANAAAPLENVAKGARQPADARAFSAHSLQAPVAGAMTRLIRESPACRARYIFSRKGRTLFALDTDKAAFEYEYGK